MRRTITLLLALLALTATSEAKRHPKEPNSAPVPVDRCQPRLYKEHGDGGPFTGPFGFSRRYKTFENSEPVDVFLAITDEEGNLISVSDDRNHDRWEYPSGCLDRYEADEAGLWLGPQGSGRDICRTVPVPPAGGSYFLLARIDQSGSVDSATSESADVAVKRLTSGTGWRIIRSVNTKRSVNSPVPNSDN